MGKWWDVFIILALVFNAVFMAGYGLGWFRVPETPPYTQLAFLYGAVALLFMDRFDA